jgi:hypothetical protein
MATFLLRVELPDRPGALGAVASRIGSVRGDVVSVEVVEHRRGKAVDEFVIELADEDQLSLLLSEVAEVDGVKLQDVRPMSGRHHDRRLEAFSTALIILQERTPHAVLTALASRVCAEIDAAWSAVLDVEGSSVIAAYGRPPAAQRLAATIAEARVDAVGAEHEHDPADAVAHPGALEGGDVGFVDLTAWDLVLVAGRPGWHFGTREHAHLAALAKLADARWADMTEHPAGSLTPAGPAEPS